VWDSDPARDTPFSRLKPDEIEGHGYRVLHYGEVVHASAFSAAAGAPLTVTVDVAAPSDLFVTFTNPAARERRAPVLRTPVGEGLMSSESGSSGSVSGETGGWGRDTAGDLDRQARAYSATPFLREAWNLADLSRQEIEVSGSRQLNENGGDETTLWGLKDLDKYYSPDPEEREEAFEKIAVRKGPTVEPHSALDDWGLRIWVEEELDDWFEGSDDEAPLSQLATAFIGTDGSGDSSSEMDDPVFDIVVDIFGEPWQEDEWPFDEQKEKTIDLFLLDINNAGVPSGTPFVIGYFNPVDLFVNDAAYSNERLILYLHAPAFAAAADGGAGDEWAITDRWPSEVVLTAAHELQHLVNFYQKTRRQDGPGIRSDVWLDELSSMTAEEFVGAPLKEHFDPDREYDRAFAGPRGIDPTDLSAGAPPIGPDRGRLPTFNAYNTRGLVSWGTEGDGALPDYSAGYAFGAWLTRNYGGAELMADILASEYGDHRAVEEAVAQAEQTGGRLSFAELLEQWSAAVLLSDRVVDERHSGYRYRQASNDENDPEGFVSEVNGREVALGSIDLFHYEGPGPDHGVSTRSGPKLYTADNPFRDTHRSYSNVYYLGPTNVEGVVELVMSVERGTRVSVIVRERLD